MSAASESGGIPRAERGISAGFPSTFTAGPNACAQVGARSAPSSDDALTVELAFSAEAEAPESKSSAEAEPGTVLGSRYLLEQLIGRGGTSSVYRARDLHPELSPGSTGSPVAVKLWRGAQRTEPLALTRLQREFHTMRALSHVGIARVYELACDGDMCFMSMQLISGQTLKAWMSAGRAQAEALRIIDTCCEAVEYSHSRGIVHGDLKPTNVLVTDDGAAMLIDFGSSSNSNTRGGLESGPAVAATRLYASPQVLAGERAEQRDDVFSLACLSYAALSGGGHPYGGHPSFEGFRAKSAPTYLPAIPVELFEVIERGLSVDRDGRPASVSEFRRQMMAAEEHRLAEADLYQPANANPAQDHSAGPSIVVLTLAGVASIIALVGKKLGGSWGFRPVKPIVASLVALMLAGAAAGAAVMLGHTGPAPSMSTGADRSLNAGVEAAHSAILPSQAPTPPLAPIPEHVRLPYAKAAPLPQDSSSISFKATIVHASARQSLVAIAVRRTPANDSRGEFVWRVEPGNAIPSIDYRRMRSQRVSFMEGQSVRTLFIPLLDKAAPGVPLGPRFFDVVLQPVAGGPSLGRFARITVVIDPAPAIWVAKSEGTSSTVR